MSNQAKRLSDCPAERLAQCRGGLVQPAGGNSYVETRQCDACNHVGINDAASGLGACHDCDWQGTDPVEDKCPGCGNQNCMAAACPKCGARYALIAEANLAIAVPPAGDEEVLAIVTLGGYFSSEELGDIDIEPRMAALEQLQQHVVRSDSDEHVELVDRAHTTRLQAEVSALQQRLNIADQRVCDLEKDKQRLDALEGNFWDVRHHSAPLADTGDYTGGVEIVGRWMDKPLERVIGEDYNENLRAAIDQAMKADAYPPARPEYPEIDAALSGDDWHMNPCKQGHRDVGACQGTAFCYTCDETITAATTQEAFEKWNATNPAAPQ